MAAISSTEAVNPATSNVVEAKKEIPQQSDPQVTPEQKVPAQAISRNPEALLKAAAETKLQPNIQEIYAKAAEKANQTVGSKSQVLYDFYSKEIRQMDPEVLKKNPELVFRRALVGMCHKPFRHHSEILDQLSELKKDCEFVVQNAEKGSRMAEVAAKRLQMAGEILSRNPQSVKEIKVIIKKIFDEFLRTWTSDTQAEGKKLRQKIFHLLKESSSFLNEFIGEVEKRFDDELDVVLGRAQLIEKKIKLSKRKTFLATIAKYTLTDGVLFTSRNIL